MTTEKPARRVRGPGKKPRFGITSVRLPMDTLDFYKSNFENATAKMREVLVNYAREGAKDGEEQE